MAAIDQHITSSMTLPTELWTLIIALSVPPPSFDELAQERQTSLARYARVCKTWRGISERLLYAHPTLATAGQAARFRRGLRCAAEAEGKGRQRLVKTLRVGKMWSAMDRDREGEYFELGELVQLCREGLEEVVVGKLEGVRVDGRFTAAKGLTALHFCDCSLHLPPPPSNDDYTHPGSSTILDLLSPLHLPNIRHLTLCDVDANDGLVGLRRLFSALPNLTALAAIHSRRPYGCIPRDLPYLHASPLPVELAGWDPPDQDPSPDRTDRLLDLYATEGENLHRRSPLVGMSCTAEEMRKMAALKNVPPSVRFLRFTSGHFFGSDFLTPFLSSAENHLSKLEELVLPMRLSTGAAYEELRRWCRENGVRVVYEKDEEGEGTTWEGRFWECVRRWEKQVEEEKEEEKRIQTEGE